MTEKNTDDRAEVDCLLGRRRSLMTDEELLLEYRLTGSSAVFETLVKRYERELYNYLRRFLNNQVLAEDAFQATFMQVHLKCHLFDAAAEGAALVVYGGDESGDRHPAPQSAASAGEPGSAEPRAAR